MIIEIIFEADFLQEHQEMAEQLAMSGTDLCPEGRPELSL